MNEFQRKVLLYLNIKESDIPELTKKVTFDDLESPYVFLDMQKARDRILKAVNNNEKIMIYGDYDCDGISATSIMVKMFQILNRKVGYYIPSRYIDGYGINVNRAKQIIAKGYSLVITVDNGVAQDEALTLLKENNIDVILTDHHAVIKDLPPYYAFVHPEYKTSVNELKQCGAYVAFMLSIAVLNYVDPYLLTLASAATISDMMPIKSYNRDLVKLSLDIINKDKTSPYHSLYNMDKVIDEDAFGFSICPKINAIGRIREDMSVNDLVRFFVTDDENIKRDILRMIDDVNNERKNILAEAINAIDFTKYENDKVIVERFDNISEGVIGLIAARLMNECLKPAIVLTKIHNQDVLKGSARSMEGLNIEDAFGELSSYLLAYGGHAGAGGLSLSIDNYEAFKVAVNHYAKDKNIIPPEEKYIEVYPNELTYDNYLFVKSLSPYGMEFPAPKFKLKIDVSSVLYMGNEKQHFRGQLNPKCSFVAFNLSEKLKNKKSVYVVGNLEYDDFKKGYNIKFKINDVLDN